MKNTTKDQLLSFEKKILLFALLVITIIGIIVYLFVQVSAESRRYRDLVAHTEKIISLADSMMINERDIVIGTRSYIITADKTYLQSFQQHSASLKKNMDEVRKLTSDNHLQQRRLDSLKPIYENYKATRDKTIALRNDRGFSLEKQLPLTQKADSALTKIAAIFNELRDEEKRLLNERKILYQEKVKSVGTLITCLMIFFIVIILLAFWVVYRNSKKRTKAEQALRKSEGLVNSIIQYAPMLVNVKDVSGKYILVNHQMAASLYTSPEEMIGKDVRNFLPQENANSITSEEEHVVKTGQPSELEVKIPGPDGVHTLITSKFPLSDATGNIYAIGSTSVDITPLKKAHEALEKSYRQQQRILNGLQQTLTASSDLLCIVNARGEFEMLTDTVTQLVGYTPKELMSKRCLDLVAEEERAQAKLIAAQIVEGQPVLEAINHFKSKDGTLVPIVWSAKWVAEDGLLYGIARNASEKLATARQLAQSQARLSHAQKIAHLGNWDWDIKNNSWSCSDEIYRQLGIDKKEVTNIPQLLLGAIHPDDRPKMEKARQEALEQGKKVDVEHRIIRADGQVCHMHTKGEITHDANGVPTWFSGTMQDITQRKEAELRLQQLNEDLQQRAAELKASNAELERFAYVASHDLQEPLRMVTSFLGLLNKKHNNDFDETSKKYIHYAVDGAERMKGLIQDLLHYSRLGSSAEKPTAVNLQEVMRDILHDFTALIQESDALINVETLPVVQGNKTQLSQLFQNLVGNALKYRGKEQPRIHVQRKEEETHWLFSVKDNGIGIDPKYFDKIFVIFQRLHNKDLYGGTGIGLAVCKKIVENHGGRIWVESSSGQGSTFYFTLNKHTR